MEVWRYGNSEIALPMTVTMITYYTDALVNGPISESTPKRRINQNKWDELETSEKFFFRSKTTK